MFKLSYPKCAIYRGTGGTGEANDDATLNAVTQQALDAATSASEAATSATAAASSATAASSSASSASTSASSASTSATNAATSASSASTSATSAANSATAAATSATNAATSETAAATSATSAASSATTATTKASEASTSASNASTSETNAANSASTATTKASEASTSASNAATSASAAATSATNASTSETNAAASETAAATSETNAATSETNAATSATNAASSATAAAASESAAATSETNAATSATTATTQASNAATSATNAATSETNAAASASSASTSATSASTSATNAASSATAAAASQTAAAASAASAASAYDSFDDRYLGTKASDPTLDNDGNALVTGALYFNSTANEMRVYDGGNWIAASSAGGASLYYYNYTATSSQTTFSGADDNANTLSYTVDNLIVTLNGVTLENGTDYTATDGTSVVLTSGASTSDELNIVAFKSFTTADMVSATNGGTFQGAVTFNAGVNFGDNDKAIFGAGSDLQIYHDGSNSYVQDAGTGHLRLGGTNLQLMNGALTEYYFSANENGTVKLYYDNAEKLSTTSTGIDVTGTVVADNVGVGLTPYYKLEAADASRLALDVSGSSTMLRSMNVAGTANVDITYNGVGHVWQNSGSERMRIDSSGNLLLGTSSNLGSSSYKMSIKSATGYAGGLLHESGISGSGIPYAFLSSTGTLVGYISTNNSSTAYLTSSDYRLKTDVQPMTGATERLKALKPVNFEWIADGTRVDGFLAHEAQEVVPEAVTGTKDAVQVWEEGEELPEGVAVGDNKLDEDGNTIPEYQGIDQSKLVPLLVAAMQEQQTVIEDLKARIEVLEGASA